MKTESATTPELVSKLLLESGRTGQLWGSAHGEERRKLRPTMEAAARALEAARDQARRDFAAARGWRLAKVPSKVYSVWGDNPWIDHPEAYLRPEDKRRPSAIVTHSYESPQSLQHYADAHGMVAEVLPWSWYYPERCTAVVLTKDRPSPFVEQVRAAMRAAGIFYAWHHKRFKPTLARVTERRTLAAVSPGWLQQWAAGRFELSLESCATLLRSLDGFPVVTDSTAELI